VPIDWCALIDVSIDRGRERWLDRFGASSCSVTADDARGVLSWDAGADSNQLAVQPGTPLRVRATDLHGGATSTLWRGFVESIDEDFAPYERPAAKLTAQDALAQLAHVDFPEQSPVGAGERSDQRVARLLDLAAWPADWRDLQAGQITVQSTNLARPVADDLGITADSEGGALFASRDGLVTFRNRDWLRTDVRARTVQATIGGPDQQVCGAAYGLVRSGADVVNDVQLARAGGTVRRFVNSTSVAIFRQRTFSRTDYICETDAQIDLLGNRILNARSNGQARIPKVRIVGTDDLATWTFLLQVDYGWQVEVHYSNPTSGAHWVRPMIVQGVSHRISVDGWVTELRVDDVSATAADTWDGVRGWDRALWTIAS
jgi:hypothetical protein